jgi:hypothetical protein
MITTDLLKSVFAQRDHQIVIFGVPVLSPFKVVLLPFSLLE